MSRRDAQEQGHDQDLNENVAFDHPEGADEGSSDFFMTDPLQADCATSIFSCSAPTTSPRMARTGSGRFPSRHLKRKIALLVRFAISTTPTASQEVCPQNWIPKNLEKIHDHVKVVKRVVKGAEKRDMKGTCENKKTKEKGNFNFCEKY